MFYYKKSLKLTVKLFKISTSFKYLIFTGFKLIISAINLEELIAIFSQILNKLIAKQQSNFQKPYYKSTVVDTR